MMSRQGTRIALAVALVAGTWGAAGRVVTAAGEDPRPAAAVGTWGFNLAGRDTAVKAGDDFFRYAVGGYVDRLQLPPDLTSWNSIVELSLKAEEDVRKVIEKASAAKPAKGTNEQKVVDVYESFLDTARIESLGLAPFKADLDEIAAAKTHDDIARLMARPGMSGNAPLAVFPLPDGKDPNRYMLAVTQAGLGMPSRDIYVSDLPAFADLRTKYRDYAEQMLAQAKYPDAGASAAAILALETKIAQAQWPLEKIRNKDLSYNPKSFAELTAYAPGFPWVATLESAHLAGRDRFVLRQLEPVRDLARLFGDTPLPTWKAYLTFHYLNAQADIMPAAFDQLHFGFFGKALYGTSTPRDRWKRAVNDVSGQYGAGPLGEAVGKLYVADHFPPEAKAAIKAVIDNLLLAYQQRIEVLPWMTPETRKAAIRKAQTVRVKIGYPDQWKDYSKLTIEPGDAYGNRTRLSIFEYDRMISRLDQPTNKDEWSQGPQTVNAYYMAEFNEIAFPAAILQAPFFDPKADLALNYGAIGGVIGHEMGHGYDDQGAKSDENGVLRTWWKAEDVSKFAELTRRLAAQYSSYSPIEGQHVNGDATSGENIGDLGGLSVSYAAYKIALGGKPAPVIDGYTGDQRFFLAWAQAWRGKYRDAALRQALTSDTHSPVMYRVNGVVRNIDAWYEAFGVKPGDALYLEPEDRVRIW